MDNPGFVKVIPCQFNVESESHHYISEVVLKERYCYCRKITSSNWQHCKAAPEVGKDCRCPSCLLHYGVGQLLVGSRVGPRLR